MERDAGLVTCGDLAVAGEAVTVGAVAERHPDELVRGHPGRERGEAAVVEELPAVDDDDPLAEGDDVGHVVAREEDRRPGAAVVLGDEPPDLRLHRHVEPDGRLVEERDLWRVKQPGRELHLHPLAERELTDRLVNERPEVEQVGELIEGPLELIIGDLVDLLEDPERVRGRDIPDELAAIPHEERHLAEVRVLATPRDEAEDPCLAARRVEQPRKRLQRGGLPRPVRAEEADDLAGLDGERDPRDRRDVFVASLHERAQRRAETGLALRDPERLAKIANLDDRAHARASLAKDAAGECVGGC